MDDFRTRLLQGLMGNPAWAEVYVPILEQERERSAAELEKFESERSAPHFSDDYLRGYGRGLRFAIHRAEDLLKEGEQAALDRVPLGPEPEAVGSPYRDPEVQG